MGPLAARLREKQQRQLLPLRVIQAGEFSKSHVKALKGQLSEAPGFPRLLRYI
jgi:hypothetical protein